MESYFKSIKELIIFRDILQDEIIKAVGSEGRADEETVYDLCCNLIKEGEARSLKGNLWKAYLLDVIITRENYFTIDCEKGLINDSSSLYKLALHDFEILKRLYNFDFRSIHNLPSVFKEQLDNFNNSTEGKELKYCEEVKKLYYSLESEVSIREVVDSFIIYYKHNGCGNLSKYGAFRFREKEGLVGIDELDKITFKELIGIDSQRETLKRNTEAFLSGAPANNVLLYGDRGTGKSSCIKALLNEYREQGLRIIELTRHQLCYFYNVLELIKSRGMHFIIFLDDLSFEDFETDYKYLKSVIEGGIEGRPSNVLVYATSNRRHIIKESWKDRESSVDDINTSEAIQEKLSLVDRFGETIVFTSPNKNEYLSIVEELARIHGVDIPIEDVKREALKWEMWHNGKSGRSAKQFINYLLGQKL